MQPTSVEPGHWSSSRALEATPARVWRLEAGTVGRMAHLSRNVLALVTRSSGRGCCVSIAGVEVVMAPEDILTPTEVADLVRTTTTWLAQARYRGDGPPFIKLGRQVRYRRQDILFWLESTTRTRT